jgi:hypothetical protein
LTIEGLGVTCLPVTLMSIRRPRDVDGEADGADVVADLVDAFGVSVVSCAEAGGRAELSL